MRALLQRVRDASVEVDGASVARIESGLLILLGVLEGDGDVEAEKLARKCVDLRIFADDDGKMNRSVEEAAGAVLVVSQFTLAADTRRGRRPSFVAAARPETARPLVHRFCEHVRARGLDCKTGVFGADMKVRSTNDGPVTIWMDTSAW